MASIEGMLDRLFKEVDSMRKDVGAIGKKMDTVHTDLQEYKLENHNKCYKCHLNYDKRYIIKEEFEGMFNKAIERYTDRLMQKAAKGSQILSNMAQVMQILSPLALFGVIYYLMGNG